MPQRKQQRTEQHRPSHQPLARLALPALQDKLAQQGATPYPTSPAEFQQVLDADVRKWAAVVKASGAQLD